MASRKQDSEGVGMAVIGIGKAKGKGGVNNMFDLLTVDEPTTKQEAKNVLVPKPVKVKASKLTGWAAMAAKPAEVAKATMPAKVAEVKAPMETGCDAWPSPLTDDEWVMENQRTIV